uniref:Uncharacterized protein n=1 Tax=Equus caballus TaxID=9796 RepID=A0A5F5PNJ3_HORSE
MVLLRVLILLLSWAAGLGAPAWRRIPESARLRRSGAQARGELGVRPGGCIVLCGSGRSR